MNDLINKICACKDLKKNQKRNRYFSELAQQTVGTK